MIDSSASRLPSTSYSSPFFHLLLFATSPARVPPESVQVRCVASSVVIMQVAPVFLLRSVRFRRLSPLTALAEKFLLVSSRFASPLPPLSLPLTDGNGSKS